MNVVESGMRVVTGKTFENRNIVLDNLYFEDCKFINCRIYYSGGQYTLGKNVVLEKTSIEFCGHAHNTVILLNRLGVHPRDLLHRSKDDEDGGDALDLSTATPLGGEQ